MVFVPSHANAAVPSDECERAPYRPPELLRPLHVFDFWELLGNQALAAQVLQLHQSSVSRIVSGVSQQLGSKRGTLSRDDPSPVRYLRLAYRAHRMGEGVLRLATDPLLQPLLEGLPSLQPVPPRFRSLRQWVGLIQEGMIDGALVASPALEGSSQGVEVSWQGVQQIGLGELELQLALPPGGGQEVLVPDAELAPLLHRQLLQRQCLLYPLQAQRQQTQDWQQIAQRRGLALPVAVAPALLPAPWLERTGRSLMPLEPGLFAPLWLLIGQEAAVAGTVREGTRLLRRRLQQAAASDQS